MKESLKRDIINFLNSEDRKVDKLNMLYSFVNSSIQCVFLIRIRNFLIKKAFTKFLAKIFGWVLERFYSTSIFTTDIGPGLLIPHPLCVVINAKSIGENCTILQGCTIGIRSNKDNHKPIIGDDVYLGAGSKILGPIKLGDRAIVGANAVVINNVPDNSTAVGIPAKLTSSAK